jgi:hypothetical protein
MDGLSLFVIPSRKICKRPGIYPIRHLEYATPVLRAPKTCKRFAFGDLPCIAFTAWPALFASSVIAAPAHAVAPTQNAEPTASYKPEQPLDIIEQTEEKTLHHAIMDIASMLLGRQRISRGLARGATRPKGLGGCHPRIQTPSSACAISCPTPARSGDRNFLNRRCGGGRSGVAIILTFRKSLNANLTVK